MAVAAVGAVVGGAIGASGVIAGVGITAGVLGGIAVASAYNSYRQGQRQQDALEASARAQRRAADARRRQAAVQNRQAAIRQVVAARRARAQTAAQGVQGGTLQSSGVQGAQASASAQASGNLGTMRELSNLDSQRFSSLKDAYSFDAAAQRFGIKAQQSASIARTAVGAIGSPTATAIQSSAPVQSAQNSFRNFIG